MTQITQINGGSYTLAVSYTGANRELYVDTSNYDLIVHDGTTPGGYRFLNMDNSDARYQARSTELDGLTGFEPQDKGILVRLGPADYRLRTLTVNAQNLTLTNANGYAGNPLLELKADIESSHTFSGVITTTQQIIASAGIAGLLTGNVVGNVTGNLTGDVTGNLLGNATGDHDGTFTGDVDTRGSTLNMDDETIQLSWLSPEVLEYIAAAGIPSGCIVQWSGSLLTIPEGWVLCDGNNSTPNLTDKFIMGAGNSYAVAASGGALTHVHLFTTAAGGGHTPSGTVGEHALTESEMPSHKHLGGATHNSDSIFAFGTAAASPSTGRRTDGNSGSGTVVGYTTDVGGGATHDHTLTMNAVGNHTHTGTSETGSSLPPYYALAFIMKA